MSFVMSDKFCFSPCFSSKIFIHYPQKKAKVERERGGEKNKSL